MTYSMPSRLDLSRQGFLRAGACAAGLTVTGAAAGPASALGGPSAPGPSAPGRGQEVASETADVQDQRDVVDDLVRGTSSFPGNDGRPHTVTWDEQSFLIDDERLL